MQDRTCGLRLGIHLGLRSTSFTLFQKVIQKGVSYMSSDFSFEIVKHLGTLKEADRDDGYAMECNLVRWNGAPTPKVDVRSWDKTHSRMTRGITLTDSEAERLAQAIAEYLESRA